MNKNRFIIYFVFLITVLFIFMPKIDAGKDSMPDILRCNYVHPSYPSCSLDMRLKLDANGDVYKEGTWLEAEWDYTLLSSQTYCTGDHPSGNPIRNVLPNIEHYKSQDKDFIEIFTKRYKKNNECPTLYIGPTIYKCTKKAGSKTSYNSLDHCFFAYLENNANKTRTKVTAKATVYENSDELGKVLEKEQANLKTLGGIADEKKKAKIDELTAIEITNNYKSCDQLIGDSTKEILEYIFLVIRVATPIILIVLTMLDFSKAIAADENELQNAITRFVKRTIAAILIFLAPTLIEFLMDITGISDGTCGLDL